MHKSSALLILLLFVTSFTLSCGGSNRQLQSITIAQSANGEQIQFVATGTFSAAPITVTPLPVSWSYAPPPPQYNLTTQPYVFSCASPQSPGPIVAMAPANPNAPTSGSMLTTKMIFNSGPINCP
jgi:hypothetical protein